MSAYVIARTALLACLMASCADPDDVANPELVVIDERDDALVAATDIRSVNGTYGAGCTNRSGSWSLKVDPAAALDNTVLSVIKGDVSCVLTLTGIRSGVGPNGTLSPATPALALGGSYAGTAASFAGGAFRANAKLGDATFMGNFTFTVLFSYDPTIGSPGSTTGAYTWMSPGLTVNTVAVPDYPSPTVGVAVTKNGSNVVQTVSGNVTLGAPSTTGGTSYAIAAGGPSTNYSSIHGFYTGATPVAMATTIPGSSFISVGATLPVTSRLYIANTVNGVASYQVFTLTFN